MKPEVAIIIPIYNSQKYIEECIDSILRNTFQNFLIIAINDGSTDNTLQILENKYGNNDKVLIINQENQGVAKTRNNGIDEAIERDIDYIMFVDSDDFIDSNYLSEFYNAIKISNSKVVIGGYHKFKDGNVLKGMELKEGIFTKFLIPGPMSKIIKTQLLKKNNIRFEDVNIAEDILFTARYCSKTDSISVIDYCGYYYRYNNDSISHTLHKGLDEKAEVIDFLDKLNNIRFAQPKLQEYFFIRWCIWYLLYSGDQSDKKRFLEWDSRLFAWLNKNYPNYKKNKYNSFFKLKEIPLAHRFIIKTYSIIRNLKLNYLFASIYCKGK